MILILHDTPEGYPFVAELMKQPCRKIYSPQRRSKILTWIAGAWDAVRESHKDDVIVSLYDFQGVLCYWIGLLTLRRRRIVVINILLKDKRSLRNKIAAFLYKKALHSKYVKATASTHAYQQKISKRIAPRYPITILPDVFYESYLETVTSASESKSDYVFSGGRNGRDWQLLIDTARLMPEVSFKISLPTSVREKLERDSNPIPKNIEFFCDVTFDQFTQLLSGSSIVALPLDTQAPAGLIVLFQAGACEKPVVITDTDSTHDYITDGRGCGIDNTPGIWAEKIREILADPTKAKTSAKKLKQFLISECNESEYVDKIEKIVNTFE